MPYRVYLPGCYAWTDQPLPVLVLFHGLTYNESQWEDLGVATSADRLIAAGKIPPLIIVMPAELKGLDFESAVVDVLLPSVEAIYHTRGDRQGRALGGLSRGAGWALRIGMEHSTSFGTIGMHSPAVLPPDLFRLAAWAADTPQGQRPRLWIDIGQSDSLRFETLDLVQELVSLGYRLTWRTFPGEHTAAYWSAHLDTYLQWYAQSWK
jgi:enterochelin esterase-like enzyme